MVIPRWRSSGAESIDAKSRGTLTFDSYAEVPKAVADEIVQKSKGD